MKTMVDLFCGRGGWTKGFQAHGWNCIGIDIFPQPDYPGEFIQADIAQLLELPPADFYCCSSPCEQFSVHGMKHFHPNPKWPWLGIALFEYSRQLLEATQKPYVMENVRLAERFLNSALIHLGPFYLWGLGVPVLFPSELRLLKKGMTSFGHGPWRKVQRGEISLAEHRAWRRTQKDSNKQQAAEIPLSLASFVAKMAGNEN